MDKELLYFYNRELALLYENAKGFAENYPGVAERLGGLLRERNDPMVAGLLEGCALLAARVQLGIKQEFPEITHNIIEQLLPNYLAPLPSVTLVSVEPNFGDPGHNKSLNISRSELLYSAYQEQNNNTRCCFTLCNDITCWPIEISQVEYIPSISGLQILKLMALAMRA